MADPPPDMAVLIEDSVLRHVRNHLTRHSWVIEHEPQLAVYHTLGLTAHGLPELVVTGRNHDGLHTQLDRWAARVLAGDLELGPTVTVHDLDLREHTFPVRRYDISARGGLCLARALYGRRLIAREIDVRACRCPPCRAGLYTISKASD